MGPFSAIKARMLKSSTVEYPYEALNETHHEIRTLEILPTNAARNGMLACRLHTVSLKSVPKPTYETISYTWGEPTPCHRLLLDEHVILIPASAKLALQRVASGDRPRTVWIDAICINQKDKVERASQVSLMGQVYSMSAANLVYLGESVESNDNILRAFSDVGRITAEIENDKKDHHVESLQDLIFRNGQFQDAPSPIAIDISGYCLDELFRRPWFRRVWIIQEVVLAPKSRCYCGNTQIDLQQVLDAAAWLAIWHRLHPLKNLAAGLDNDGLNAAASIWQLGLGTRSMRDTLSNSHEVHASDERDRVFGVLGMLYPNAKVPELLRPSYGKPLAEVYRDAMRYCIEAENDTRGFASVIHRDGSEINADGWPSWVPRFHLLYAMVEDHQSLRKVYNNRYRRLETPPRSDHDPDPDPNMLVLCGFKIDRITQLSETWWIRPQRPMQDIRDFLGLVTGDKSPCRDHNRAQLARTLIAGITFTSRRSIEQNEAGLEALLDTKDRHIKPYPECDTDSDDNVMMASCYYHAMLFACRGRKVAVTASGYLGLVPEICREGDIVSIMHNCIKPLALRPVNDNEYQMLGECYLDGFMWEEERVHLEQKGKRTERLFHIR